VSLLYIIIAVAFIDLFSQLPIIVTFAVSLGASPLLVGIIIGIYYFSNMLGNVMSGIWIDRIGSKKILYPGMIIAGIIVFFYSLVQGPFQLLAFRFIHGFVAGFIVPAAFALLGRLADQNSKGKTMAVSGAAIGIAAIIGPAFGSIVTSRFGEEWLFYSMKLFDTK
jgi:DHA1 family multidrug resistance protein-like MFS transporter